MLRDPLALGAVGVVFDAAREDGSASSPVAIHLPFAAQQESEQIRTAYARHTAEALAIRHPNLVAVLDGGSGALVWRVMERAAGWTLAALIQRARSRGASISWAIALDLCEKVGDGLAALHDRQGVHGRLSASRVLLLPDGAVKVCGWCTPSFVPSASSLSETPAALADLAPEQILGLQSVAATDVYHLALLLVTAQGRGTPFRASTAERMHRAILSEPVPLPEDMPETLRETVRAALSRGVADRPSLDELRSAIRAGLQREGRPDPESVRGWMGGLLTGVSLLAAVSQQSAASTAAEAVRARIAHLNAVSGGRPPWTLLAPAALPPAAPPAPALPPAAPPPPEQPAPAAPRSGRRLALLLALMLGAAGLGYLARPGAAPSTSGPPGEAAPPGAPAATAATAATAPPPAPETSAPPSTAPEQREEAGAAEAEPATVAARPVARAPEAEPRRAPASARTSAPSQTAATSSPSARATSTAAPAPEASPPAATVAAPAAVSAPTVAATASTASTAPPPAPEVPQADPSAVLSDLSVSVGADKVTLRGTLRGESRRPLGMLVEDGSSCEYRLKLQGARSDVGLSRLPVASPLVSAITVTESGSDVTIRARCGATAIQPTLSSSSDGFVLVLAQK